MANPMYIIQGTIPSPMYRYGSVAGANNRDMIQAFYSDLKLGRPVSK